MSLYVYAVLRGTAAGENGPPADSVSIVQCGGIEAAVRPTTDAPAVDAEGLRAHDAVVRRLHAQAAAVLPMRFGAMVRDEAALRSWVDTARPILDQGLDLVAGREQMAIRIYGEVAEATAEDRHDVEQRGTRYLMTRRAASMPPELVPAMETLRARLSPLIHSERVERHATPPLIVTVRHLVARGAGDAYRAAIEGDLPGFERLTRQVSGPWPPYAFTPEELS
ncbi:MAG TPA: GvpL/GvpF family gas vesicle protein [Methylomirabilota bacterium]|jgi:hypothetical protein|nr:GvpL/GvpF family gas vesicle protein [Methylomirabilota bacterium]